MRSRVDYLVLILASLALAALAAGAATAGDVDRCYSADIPGTVVLPDGQARAAGHLRICSAGALNPATTLHALYWNGRALGLYRGRRDEVEASALRDGGVVFVFVHAPGRQALVLEGYALGRGHTARTFDLTPRGLVASRWQLSRPTEPVSASADDGARVLVAAASNR